MHSSQSAQSPLSRGGAVEQLKPTQGLPDPLALRMGTSYPLGKLSHVSVAHWDFLLFRFFLWRTCFVSLTMTRTEAKWFTKRLVPLLGFALLIDKTPEGFPWAQNRLSISPFQSSVPLQSSGRYSAHETRFGLPCPIISGGILSEFSDFRTS